MMASAERDFRSCRDPAVVKTAGSASEAARAAHGSAGAKADSGDAVGIQAFFTAVSTKARFAAAESSAAKAAAPPMGADILGAIQSDCWLRPRNVMNWNSESR